MKAHIRNASAGRDIYVTLTPAQDQQIPRPVNLVLPGGSAVIQANTGVMRLTVWENSETSPIWSGMVPTFINKPIDVYPENRQVTYDRVALPEMIAPRKGCLSMTWVILIILIVLALILCFWMYKKRR